MDRQIELPLTRAAARALRSGESVLLSGELYAARDAAHKRLIECLERGGELPFSIRDATIYYVGPTPARPGRPIGSAGPTTSSRMDAYAPRLIELGQTGMIGKGRRSQTVAEAMQEYGAVYFGALGGAGALLAACVRSSQVIAYEDLGAEAIRRLVVEDLPVTVIMDSAGGNLYESGRRRYLEYRSATYNLP